MALGRLRFCNVVVLLVKDFAGAGQALGHARLVLRIILVPEHDTVLSTAYLFLDLPR